MVLILIKGSLSQSNGQLLSLLLAGNKSIEIKSVCMSSLVNDTYIRLNQ